MSQSNLDLALIDKTTGEIIDEYSKKDRLHVTRETQMDYANNHVLRFNKEKTFVKIYDEVVPLLEKYLTTGEFKFAFCLTPHISFEDCIIRKTQDRRSKILNIREIAEIHGYRYDYVRKLMSSLKNKGVIGKHETGSILKDYSGEDGIVYTVNPYIYFRGNDILKPTHAFYENSGWRELLMKDTDPHQVVAE